VGEMGDKTAVRRLLPGLAASSGIAGFREFPR